MSPLSFDDMVARLRQRFGDKVLAVDAAGPSPSVTVEGYAVASVLRYLRDDAELGLDFLQFVTAVDWPGEDKITVVYSLFSYPRRHSLVVKADVPRRGGRLPTAAAVYPAAEWHEREVYDLFGVVFDGHPDLRRILMPDDYQGHPLLKDFRNPEYIPFPEK